MLSLSRKFDARRAGAKPAQLRCPINALAQGGLAIQEAAAGAAAGGEEGRQ